MSMSLGKPNADPEVMVEMNTTPLIDVMLVLLVMLIITLPIQLHSVNLNMPIGNPPPPLIKPEVVKLDIDATGAIYWNGEVVPDRQALEDNIGVRRAWRCSRKCTCVLTRVRSMPSLPA